VWEAEGRFLPRWESGLGCDAGGDVRFGVGGGAYLVWAHRWIFWCREALSGWWGLESWRDGKGGMVGGARVVLVVNGNWGAGRGRRVEFGYVSAKTFDGTDFKQR